ncbi:MAG: hypothetical protein K8F25_16285, partial [Fimbriimonadaceae bacterium]|nr:hypothetical protein [Alphaproteobacteria bacterium]
ARVLPASFDGLMMGVGFTFGLVLLGACREIIGSGTLFANASILLGQGASFLELNIIPDYRGFLLFALPPGGFIVLGFLLAGHRIISQRSALGAQNEDGDALELEDIGEDIVALEDGT